jgi:hypothetical protein
MKKCEANSHLSRHTFMVVCDAGEWAAVTCYLSLLSTKKGNERSHIHQRATFL